MKGQAIPPTQCKERPLSTHHQGPGIKGNEAKVRSHHARNDFCGLPAGTLNYKSLDVRRDTDIEAETEAVAKGKGSRSKHNRWINKSMDDDDDESRLWNVRLVTQRSRSRSFESVRRSGHRSICSIVGHSKIQDARVTTRHIS